MSFFSFDKKALSVLLSVFLANALSLPYPGANGAVDAYNSTFYRDATHFLQRSEQDIPPIPPRPAGIGKETFHGSEFQFFDQRGFQPDGPAAKAAPVYLFARIDKNQVTCYPESAVVIGSDPLQQNPGTHYPSSLNPGQNCNDPGDYHGDYTIGNSFPVYVSATWCGNVQEWRLNYDLYFVHDGAVSSGHRHDWQDVTVVFKQDPSGEDWWYRDSIFLSAHKGQIQYGWGEIQTVDGLHDVTNEDAGTRLNHPKVYVGMYKHALFKDKMTDDKTYGASAPFEYRSTDWYRLPEVSDFHLWSEIPADWSYGSATSTPAYIKTDPHGVCSYVPGSYL